MGILDEDQAIRYRRVPDELAQQPNWLEVQAALPATPRHFRPARAEA